MSRDLPLGWVWARLGDMVTVSPVAIQHAPGASLLAPHREIRFVARRRVDSRPRRRDLLERRGSNARCRCRPTAPRAGRVQINRIGAHGDESPRAPRRHPIERVGAGVQDMADALEHQRVFDPQLGNRSWSAIARASAPRSRRGGQIAAGSARRRRHGDFIPLLASHVHFTYIKN
jgi:hypothetical protein